MLNQRPHTPEEDALMQAHAAYHLARIELEKMSEACKKGGVENELILVALTTLQELDREVVRQYGSSRMG